MSATIGLTSSATASQLLSGSGSSAHAGLVTTTVTDSTGNVVSSSTAPASAPSSSDPAGSRLSLQA